MLSNNVRVVVGPEHMYVSRYNIRSEDVQLDNKHFVRIDATNTYYKQVHLAAVKHVQTKLMQRKIKHIFISKFVTELRNFAAADNFTWHFDAPPWIICSKPWKQAKYKEWFFVGAAVRNKLKQRVNNVLE